MKNQKQKLEHESNAIKDIKKSIQTTDMRIETATRRLTEKQNTDMNQENIEEEAAHKIKVQPYQSPNKHFFKNYNFRTKSN